MQVPTSVAIMPVLRFYCNFFGDTFCYTYVGGSFCCSYKGDCFCCNDSVRYFCNTYAGESFSSKYVRDNFYWNFPGWSLCCRLCFLQYIMDITVFIVIMQIAVSVVAMYVTVSSRNFLFLSLIDIHFSKNGPENI